MYTILIGNPCFKGGENLTQEAQILLKKYSIGEVVDRLNVQIIKRDSTSLRGKARSHSINNGFYT